MRAEYRFELTCTCPVDDRPDVYVCTVRAARTIPVEDVLRAAAGLREKKLYQEDVTRELHRQLAAEVETVGWHSGVHTRVTVGGAG